VLLEIKMKNSNFYVLHYLPPNRFHHQICYRLCISFVKESGAAHKNDITKIIENLDEKSDSTISLGVKAPTFMIA
jgi:hypothetical protein